MTIEFSLTRNRPKRGGLHAVGVFSDDAADGKARSDQLDWAVLDGAGFEGKDGQIQLISDAIGPLAVVGLGERASIDAALVRRAGAAVAKTASRQKRLSVGILDSIGDELDRREAAGALSEGIVLGAYTFTELKSSGEPNKIESVTYTGGGGKKVADAAAIGAQLANAECWARDLVNRPGGALTPTVFAREALAMAKREGLRAKVMDLAAIKKAKLGGILGVNRGSTQHPRFVELTYQPKGKRKGSVALVGKGITFDAGGLSIKSGAGMMTMKCDMAGAAAVLGAMSTLKMVQPKCKVTAYVPMTDNMLGGDATRPGDVLRIRNGKTVEVLNTDAEGRLILADALSLASEAKPDAIIDLATLTGAMMVALGADYAGLMANDEGLSSQIRAAAERAGENVWPMPLAKEYRSQLDSSIADLRNIGKGNPGGITAGLFLQEFVAGGIPWAHIDIAGPAFVDAPTKLGPKGATGFAVRTLVELVANFEVSKSP